MLQKYLLATLSAQVALAIINTLFILPDTGVALALIGYWGLLQVRFRRGSEGQNAQDMFVAIFCCVRLALNSHCKHRIYLCTPLFFFKQHLLTPSIHFKRDRVLFYFFLLLDL